MLINIIREKFYDEFNKNAQKYRSDVTSIYALDVVRKKNPTKTGQQRKCVHKR